jgi:hypothetical protein
LAALLAEEVVVSSRAAVGAVLLPSGPVLVLETARTLSIPIPTITLNINHLRTRNAQLSLQHGNNTVFLLSKKHELKQLPTTSTKNTT